MKFKVLVDKKHWQKYVDSVVDKHKYLLDDRYLLYKHTITTIILIEGGLMFLKYLFILSLVMTAVTWLVGGSMIVYSYLLSLQVFLFIGRHFLRVLIHILEEK